MSRTRFDFGQVIIDDYHTALTVLFGFTDQSVRGLARPADDEQTVTNFSYCRIVDLVSFVARMFGIGIGVFDILGSAAWQTQSLIYPVTDCKDHGIDFDIIECTQPFG